MQNNKSILETLLYFDIFSFAPSFEELHTFLIGEKVSKKELKKRLATDTLVTSKRGWFCLRSRFELLDQREIKQIISLEKRNFAKNEVQYLLKIPTVQAVALSGSVACNNATEGDDIDLFVITSPGSVWMTRLLVYSLLKITGKMRGKQNKHNLFCPNMFVSLSNSQISEKNLYTASEIAHLSVLYEKNNSFAHFLNSNKWIKEYFPNFTIPKQNYILMQRQSHFLKRLDSVLFFIQKQFMKRKITNEKIERERIQFHPNNLAYIVLKLFKARRNAYLNSAKFTSFFDQFTGDNAYDHTPGS